MNEFMIKLEKATFYLMLAGLLMLTLAACVADDVYVDRNGQINIDTNGVYTKVSPNRKPVVCVQEAENYVRCKSVDKK